MATNRSRCPGPRGAVPCFAPGARFAASSRWACADRPGLPHERGLPGNAGRIGLLERRILGWAGRRTRESSQLRRSAVATTAHPNQKQAFRRRGAMSIRRQTVAGGKRRFCEATALFSGAETGARVLLLHRDVHQPAHACLRFFGAERLAACNSACRPGFYPRCGSACLDASALRPSHRQGGTHPHRWGGLHHDPYPAVSRPGMFWKNLAAAESSMAGSTGPGFSGPGFGRAPPADLFRGSIDPDTNRPPAVPVRGAVRFRASAQPGNRSTQAQQRPRQSRAMHPPSLPRGLRPGHGWPARRPEAAPTGTPGRGRNPSPAAA